MFPGNVSFSWSCSLNYQINNCLWTLSLAQLNTATPSAFGIWVSRKKHIFTNYNYTIHPWIQSTVLCSSKFIVLWQTTEVTHQDSSLSGSYHQFVAWSTQEIHPRSVLFLSAWSWALHENFVDCCCARESYLSHGERLSSLLTCQSLVCVSANYNYWVRLTIF